MDLHATSGLEANGCSIDLYEGPSAATDGEDVLMVRWSIKQQSDIADWDLAWQSAESEVLRTPGTMLVSALRMCKSYLPHRPKARTKIPIDS